MEKKESHQTQYIPTWPGTFKSYITAFLVSLALTLIAYFAVVEQWFYEDWILLTILIGVALLQAFIQLVLFLHLGKEDKPYWNLILFGFMALVIFILVAGTLWIMYNLDHRVMM